VLEGAPGEQILKEASEWDAQLIVMGSRGHGGLTKLWLGSVSQEVVLQAPCPVEVIRNT
jgi:nucleotide-binding universal stress UspA family protein